MGLWKKIKSFFKKIREIFRKKEIEEEKEELEKSEESEGELEEEEEYYEEDRKEEEPEDWCDGEEVQDIIIVWESDYHEKKKRRVWEISLYVELEDVPIWCLEDDQCVKVLAEEAFELAANELEGGAFSALLHSAIDPRDFSIDSESALYCSGGDMYAAYAHISITGYGKTRHYSTKLGQKLADKVNERLSRRWGK